MKVECGGSKVVNVDVLELPWRLTSTRDGGIRVGSWVKVAGCVGSFCRSRGGSVDSEDRAPRKRGCSADSCTAVLNQLLSPSSRVRR